jgi:hypothetical protein
MQLAGLQGKPLRLGYYAFNIAVGCVIMVGGIYVSVAELAAGAAEGGGEAASSYGGPRPRWRECHWCHHNVVVHSVHHNGAAVGSRHLDGERCPVHATRTMCAPALPH